MHDTDIQTIRSRHFVWSRIDVYLHVFISGLTKYLNAGYNIHMPPDQIHYCAISAFVVAVSTECSTWFILSMTFERFYSIIRPHKAASFNTVKRAKVIIMCIVIISTVYSLPHYFMTVSEGNVCVPFATGQELLIVKLYFWLDQVIGFVFPFVSLLIMNSVIIHTLCRRSKSPLRSEKQGPNQRQNEGQSSKMTTSEKQIITMLLLVTFGFLILMTPSYGVFYYFSFADLSTSPKAYAGSLLFFSIGEKTLYTNFGINFYLYVISGHKFRGDLLLLFKKLSSCFRGKKFRSADKTAFLTLSFKTTATSVEPGTYN